MYTKLNTIIISLLISLLPLAALAFAHGGFHSAKLGFSTAAY
jgi:hypothetical protein